MGNATQAGGEESGNASQARPDAAVTRSPDSLQVPAPDLLGPGVPEAEIARLRRQFGEAAARAALEALARQPAGRVQNPLRYVQAVAKRAAEGRGLVRRDDEPPVPVPSTAQASPSALPAPAMPQTGAQAGGRSRAVAAVLTGDTAEAVSAALRGRDVHIWTVGRGGGPAEMAELAYVPADVLLVDLAAGPQLGPALLRYRTARPVTRIVLLAPGRTPGDADVDEVVKLGVYDVVEDLDGLAAVLDRPAADFAAAARWIDPARHSDASRRDAPARRERVVERPVPMRQHPALVVVAGVAHGVGTTAVACAVAGLLARRGHDCALVEAGDGAPALVPTQPNFELQAAFDPGEVWLPHLAVWPATDPGVIHDVVRSRTHPYVVADVSDHRQAATPEPGRPPQ